MLTSGYWRTGGPITSPACPCWPGFRWNRHGAIVTAGRRIGTLITGYPGSPLAGYDLHLDRARALLAGQGVRHLPAGNEEQATTALMGTQMLDDHPHSTYSGVTGFWYGKGPGADRAGDALKHANFAGTSKDGAVVVLSGEDHEAKSSTMPFQQEYAFVSAGIPILYPSSVAEFRTLGLHAVALSRHSGCWVALKLVAELCDGGETVTVAPDDVDVAIPNTSSMDGRSPSGPTSLSSPVRTSARNIISTARGTRPPSPTPGSMD